MGSLLCLPFAYSGNSIQTTEQVSKEGIKVTKLQQPGLSSSKKLILTEEKL